MAEGIPLKSVRLREQVGHSTSVLTVGPPGESNRTLHIKALTYHPELAAVRVEVDGKPDELLPWTVIGKATVADEPAKRGPGRPPNPR